MPFALLLKDLPPAKKAHLSQDSAQDSLSKIGYIKTKVNAAKKLFDELVEQFTKREGGYTHLQACLTAFG